MNETHKQHIMDFFEKIKNDNSDAPRSRFLLTEFEKDIWHIECTQNLKFSVDFNIKLSDDTSLTEKKNSRLLNVFKHWIIASLGSAARNSASPTGDTAYSAVRITINLIDYLLLNDRDLKISSFGLSIITEGDFLVLLSRLAESTGHSEAIYDSQRKLEAFLRAQIDILSEAQVRDAVYRLPEINQDLHTDATARMGLSTSEIALARCWLFMNHLYMTRSTGYFPYAYVLDSKKMNKILYPNILGGKYRKEYYNAFSLCPIPRFHSEYIPADTVDSRKVSRTARGWRKYLSQLQLLLKLPPSCEVPRDALSSLCQRDLTAIFNVMPSNRTRTLPVDLVFKNLRNAIEFYLKYGQAILDDTIKYLISLTTFSPNKSTSACFNNDYPRPSKVIPNVRYWSLIDKYSCAPPSDRDKNVASFYTAMRDNQGLYELIEVLYGCIIVVLGTLMARRQAELMELRVNDSIDPDSDYLIFHNRKSGAGNYRQLIKRPLPKIAKDMLQSLIHFHKKLQVAGIQNFSNCIFDIPSQAGDRMISINTTKFNRLLDRFCDYFETPIDHNGQRLYIRAHQLRRFFALLFFWGNAAGGMDTLRWFLGHTDVEHLYHYITEITPGDILASTKASYIATQMRVHPEENMALESFVQESFGAEAVSILDEDELNEYLTELILNQKVTVEPIFFTDNDLKSYRIAVKVNENAPS